MRSAELIDFAIKIERSEVPTILAYGIRTIPCFTFFQITLYGLEIGQRRFSGILESEDAFRVFASFGERRFRVSAERFELPDLSVHHDERSGATLRNANGKARKSVVPIGLLALLWHGKFPYGDVR